MAASNVNVSIIAILIMTVSIMTRSGLPDLGALFISCSGCGGSASQTEHQSAVVLRHVFAAGLRRRRWRRRMSLDEEGEREGAGEGSSIFRIVSAGGGAKKVSASHRRPSSTRRS